MAAPADNLQSLGHLTSNDESKFTKQLHGVKKSRAMHLQLCLQELKGRERRAQEHNKQLLQQFEKAQDSLKEMLSRIAAMKTIRMEYERYLEENFPRWQQQLQEKTQAAQHKRMEDCQRAYLTKTEENQMLASAVDKAWLSQGPQKSVAPRVFPAPEKSDYVQDNSSYDLHAQSWLTHTGRFPDSLRAPHQPHKSFLFPPSAYLYPPSLLPQHLTPMFDRQPWSRQDHTDVDLGPFAAGIPPVSLGHLYTEEPPASRTPQTVEEHEMSRVPSSNGKKDGGSRSCSSPDLDIKPVRLSSSPAESSESDRGSRLASREKARREKRGRTQHPSSERRTAAKSFNKPDVTASVLLPRSSESSASSEEGSINVPVVSRQSVEGATEQTKTDVEEESQSTQEEESSNEECPSEKVGTQSHAGSSESCGAEQEPGKNVIKTETRAEEETDDQEGSSQEKDEGGRLKNLGDQEETSEEQSSDMEEGDHDDSTRITEEEAQDRMEDQGGAEEETDDQDSSQEKDGERLKNPGDQEETSEEQSSDVEEGDHDDSTRIPEEAQDMMEDQGEAEEQPNVLKSKDTEIQKQGPVSSQDEDEDEDEDEMEQDEEESSEDQGEETEESGDSEDVIITPQIKGSKQIQIISEEVEENKSQSSNEVSDEDIEDLLAPLKADEKPKVICRNMDIFQAAKENPKMDEESDSDDHFYD